MRQLTDARRPVWLSRMSSGNHGSLFQKVFVYLCTPVWLGILALLPASRVEAATETDETLVWTDATTLTIRGQGWDDVQAPFDRFPERARELVRPEVWSLSRDSAGLYVEFFADTARLAVRWGLTRDRLSLPHMPSTGASGLDLYVWDDGEARWRWLANGRPQAFPANERVLVQDIPAAERRYRLYLPLYNGVTAVEIGAETALRDAPADEDKPLVFYGTSITQGACAARPGMAYPALLGRQLNRPAINLGFSGNGRLEPEVAGVVAELDPAVFIIDPLPNVSGPSVTPLLEEFLAILRQTHPETPVVLVENIVYTDAYLVTAREARHADSSRQMRALWQKLSADDENLYLVKADQLLGHDGEDTVDGTHPTDLGFYRIAQGLLPTLREILGEEP